MLHFYHAGAGVQDTVMLSPQDWNVRERRETKFFPDITVKIKLGGREFTILDRSGRGRQ
jgi:hypothetical protein